MNNVEYPAIISITHEKGKLVETEYMSSMTEAYKRYNELSEDKTLYEVSLYALAIQHITEA